MRLYTRRGYIWTDRYPRIVDALHSLRARSIIIDGEAVICGTDGKSDFGKLHSGVHDANVFLYGFDLIELDGEDLRPAPERGEDVRYRASHCRAGRPVLSRSRL